MQINTQQHLQAVHIVIYQQRRKTMQKTVLNDVFRVITADWRCEQSKVNLVQIGLQKRVLHAYTAF